MLVETVRIVEPVPPAESATELALNVTVGPRRRVGVKLVVMLTVPAKPFKLVRVKVAAPCDPLLIEKPVVLAAIEKSGEGELVLNVAVWTVSETPGGVPFAIVTQVLGTLVLVQPVWNVSGIPEVALVML